MLLVNLVSECSACTCRPSSLLLAVILPRDQPELTKLLAVVLPRDQPELTPIGCPPLPYPPAGQAALPAVLPHPCHEAAHADDGCALRFCAVLDSVPQLVSFVLNLVILCCACYSARWQRAPASVGATCCTLHMPACLCPAIMLHARMLRFTHGRAGMPPAHWE